MTPDELKETLRADGWQIETDGYAWKRTGVGWWAWKVFDGLLDCVCNEKPPHIAIIPWDHSDHERTLRSVQFMVTGEAQGGQWVELQVYSVSMDEALTALPHAVNVLRTAWNAAATQPTP